MIKLKELLKNGREIGIHVTHGKYLRSILKKGLVPKSPTMGNDQDDEGVYFFPDEVTLQDAWDA